MAGVVVNVYVLPLLLLLSALTPLGALTAKSLVQPSVAPLLPLALIVHVMALPARCGLPPTHDSVDAVVGVPYTTIVVGLLATATVELTFTLTAKPLLATVGVVLNVNVEPPLLLVGTMLLLALDDTLKSLATPVVAPPLPLTLIVHVMATLVRCGLPLAQLTVLTAVGVPYTTNVDGPVVM